MSQLDDLRSVQAMLGWLPIRLIVFCFLPLAAAPQTPFESPPVLTPSLVTIVVGDSAAFTAVDSSGRPISSPQVEIDLPIAQITVEGSEILLSALKPGKGTLKATFAGRSATASVTILEDKALPAGTVRWSVAPTPGFATLRFLQTSLNGDSDVGLYSIEWSRTSPALLRAFRSSGQQLWRVQLSSYGKPEAKDTLAPAGQIFLNENKVNSLAELADGPIPQGLAAPPTPDHFQLPPDGQSLLLRVSGAESGDLLILERGRFRDSLVQISAADGNERWRYRSRGRLVNEWTVNFEGDVAIVETNSSPVSSSLLLLKGSTGELRAQITLPLSSTTIDGFRCKDPVHNLLVNKRISPAGSVFTSSDGNMYMQVEIHVESAEIRECKGVSYSFDNSLSLLRVTPAGDAEWKEFQHIHADGKGGFVVQPRVLAGESIPDGFGGVLAAWTYFYPGDKLGNKARFEARLTRISPSGQRDFILPIGSWPLGFFDSNMVLGEGNPLYATNGKQLIRFDTEAGETNWVRQPPSGSVRIQFSTSSGGILISNSGRLVFFDAKGNGAAVPWTAPASNSENVGLVQSNPLDHTPLPPLQLRDLQISFDHAFLAVEDGAPYGSGALLSIAVN